MSEYPDFERAEHDEPAGFTDGADQPLISKQRLQEIAHDRGRICRKRGCVVCAPLVERRRLKKKQRKAETQAAQHAKGRPCGRRSCSLETCVAARTERPSEPLEQQRGPTRREAQLEDPDQIHRRWAERHRVGLPCGSEDCVDHVCVEGFANERTRRHRAGRPCRGSTCDNAICAAARSSN